jgi:hypothetical protein
MYLGEFSPLQSTAFSDVARDLGATSMQVALAWLLQRARDILLIPDTSSIGHLQENLAAGHIVLPAEAITALERIGAESRAYWAAFCGLALDGDAAVQRKSCIPVTGVNVYRRTDTEKALSYRDVTRRLWEDDRPDLDTIHALLRIVALLSNGKSEIFWGHTKSFAGAKRKRNALVEAAAQRGWQRYHFGFVELVVTDG